MLAGAETLVELAVTLGWTTDVLAGAETVVVLAVGEFLIADTV